jgi:hypothetical protein
MEKKEIMLFRKLLKKTKKASRKNGSKEEYSKLYIKRIKKNLAETAHATVVLSKSVGLNVHVTTFCVSDKFGNQVNLKYGTEIGKKI